MCPRVPVHVPVPCVQVCMHGCADIQPVELELCLKLNGLASPFCFANAVYTTTICAGSFTSLLLVTLDSLGVAASGAKPNRAPAQSKAV